MTAVHFINKNDWPLDINFMHQKFGVHEWIEKNKDNKVNSIVNFVAFNNLGRLSIIKSI